VEEATVSARKPFKIEVKQARCQDTSSDTSFPDFDFWMGFLTRFDSEAVPFCSYKENIRFSGRNG
jgi:hypothetical protein